MPLNEIWLGDFLRATHHLGAEDTSTRSQIAQLLGLQPPAAAESIFANRPEEVTAPQQTQAASIERAEFTAVTPSPRSSPAITSSSAAAQADSSIPAELVELPPLPTAQVEFAYADVLPETQGSVPLPKLLPLFPPKQVRNMLSRLLARRAHTGPWDIPLAVEQSARGELITQIPRLPLPTLANGVQLLVDRGPALMVYSSDFLWLQKHIFEVVGKEKVSVLEFTGSPQQVFDRRQLDLQLVPYEEHIPPYGTVVAVLTDLGIGRPPSAQERSTPHEWLELAFLLRRRRCPLVAFVPYGPARWPLLLKKAFTIVHLDWTTNSGSLAALVGKGQSLSVR